MSSSRLVTSRGFPTDLVNTSVNLVTPQAMNQLQLSLNWEKALLERVEVGCALASPRRQCQNGGWYLLFGVAWLTRHWLKGIASDETTEWPMIPDPVWEDREERRRRITRGRLVAGMLLQIRVSHFKHPKGKSGANFSLPSPIYRYSGIHRFNICHQLTIYTDHLTSISFLLCTPPTHSM